MKRYEERKTDFKNALFRLKEGLKKGDDDLYIDGILQRFEFTFELAWKTTKDYLEYEGLDTKIGSPREVIQIGFKQGIIKDGDKWIKMMLARNELSHIYDENMSRRIYNDIKNEYVSLLTELEEALDK